MALSVQATTVLNHFHIEEAALLACFPDDKRNLWDRLGSCWQRIRHYAWTGAWVNERRICTYVDQHREERVSDLFPNKSVQRKILRVERNFVPHQVAKDSQVFRAAYQSHRAEVGTMFTCSPRVAKEIVRMIPKDPQASKRVIYEIGSGTGAFAERIIKRMNPGDTLVLFEFVPSLCEHLRARFDHIPGVQIREGDILSYEGGPADYVVASIPMNSMPNSFVVPLLSKYRNLTKPGGWLSNVGYRFLPPINRMLIRLGLPGRTHDTLEEFNAIVAEKDLFFDECGRIKSTVWRNRPPAWVWHHQMKQKTE